MIVGPIVLSRAGPTGLGDARAPGAGIAVAALGLDETGGCDTIVDPVRSAEGQAMGELRLERMSQEEFLAWQERQERLYELVDGVPVLPLKMMTGASQAHDRILVNVIAALHRQLR